MNPSTFFGNGSGGGRDGGNNFVSTSNSCTSSSTIDNKNKHLQNQNIFTTATVTKVADSNTRSLKNEENDDDESWWMTLD